MPNGPIEADCCQCGVCVRVLESSRRFVLSVQWYEQQRRNAGRMEAVGYCCTATGCAPDSGAASRLRAFLSERSSTSV